MAFSQTHDEWIQKGLVDATFTLHVLPPGQGSWGQVEDLPVDVYGPSTVDLHQSFPQIRWIDRTSESVMSGSRVSRSLFQAVSHRNPFKAAGSIVEVSVRDVPLPDDSRVYRWKILFDETGTQDEITAEMHHLYGHEMRALQNSLSGYRNLRFILTCELFMAWGHHGRFIVIFTGLCVGGLGLLIRRWLRQVQTLQADMAVRDVAAHSRILESVAQDPKAAENLMLFNQQRRLRMVDKELVETWERETFDWVEHHVDPDTGKTRRKQRDDRLKNKSKMAFTLIELLVVIAIIAVLMGILIPTLRRVMQQGRTVVCASHLKQWSYCFEMYTSEHNTRFMPGIDEDWSTGKYSWIYTLMKYYNEPEIRLCPEAKKTETQGGLLPWTAWDVSETNPADFTYLTDPTYKVGSYGINWWVASSPVVNGAHEARNKWRTTGQKGAANIPVLMDCGFMLARPEPSDPAPEQDGEFLWSFGGGMRRVCTSRHHGKVNILFMDWSTRKIQLKELWRLKWHKGFKFDDPLPAWPEWIEALP